MKVTVKSWTGVATWRWIANDDNCGICRMPFDSCCPDCKLPGDDCPLVWGACSHCFHIHCIVKWLQSQPQQQCPMEAGRGGGGSVRDARPRGRPPRSHAALASEVTYAAPGLTQRAPYTIAILL
ncbi:hypothetical protein MSG28_006319 [Choristoneura fumiferana]|uniref:Uncharacterized protein n=1 Tax=Choristoneura fumiferana TaxID=7141 RepID=A0ACC0JEH8_CHOFU|nr:hypothetical protein MSG28_006319 [Choristoneura fumiferana]